MTSAADFLPERSSLTALRTAAADCRGCDLYRDATQTVFGQGPARARIVMVGEQPGDREAGLVRDEIYLANVVKHFKHVVAGSAGSIASLIRRRREPGRAEPPIMRRCAEPPARRTFGRIRACRRDRDSGRPS